RDVRVDRRNVELAVPRRDVVHAQLRDLLTDERRRQLVRRREGVDRATVNGDRRRVRHDLILDQLVQGAAQVVRNGASLERVERGERAVRQLLGRRDRET